MATLVDNELDNPTIADLVLAAREGDRNAFGELSMRFRDAVFAVAMRRLNHDAEAQELTQEVMVQALERLDQLREPSRFGGWLRQIADRMAINRAIRRRPVTSIGPALLDSVRASTATPLAHALEQEQAHLVREGLHRLKELDRRTLEAFYVDGESLREMSDSFDSPIGTIKRRLHVARKRLAVELATQYGR